MAEFLERLAALLQMSMRALAVRAEQVRYAEVLIYGEQYGGSVKMLGKTCYFVRLEGELVLWEVQG